MVQLLNAQSENSDTLIPVYTTKIDVKYKKYNLIAQQLNTQSKSSEIELQSYLTKIDVKNQKRYKRKKKKLGIPLFNEIQLKSGPSIDSISNWKLIGYERTHSSSYNLPKKMKTQLFHLYKPTEKEILFNSDFIFTLINTRELKYQEEPSLESALCPSNSWSLFTHKDYLIVSKRDCYTGSEGRDYSDEVYYFIKEK